MARTGAILDQLRSEGRSGAPPTVYRTLDFLLEQGLVHRLASLNAFVACCDPAERHGGQFLICEACGRVGELNSARVETTIVEEAAADGGQGGAGLAAAPRPGVAEPQLRQQVQARVQPLGWDLAPEQASEQASQAWLLQALPQAVLRRALAQACAQKPEPSVTQAVRQTHRLIAGAGRL